MSKVLSSSDWTATELRALKIVVETLDPVSFFGSPLPAPTVDPILLNNVERPPGQISKDHRLFFRYLEDATNGFLSGPAPESAVSDFAAFLLEMMDYDEPECVVHRRQEIAFTMCGHKVDARPDVVIMNDQNYILLLQEDKCRLSSHDAESQLISGAVAAYCAYNRHCHSVGLPSVARRVFAGIVMSRSAFTFYKIPISFELVTAISRGDYPANTTVVSKFIPPVPNPAKYNAQGMVPLENRRIIFQCLAAFKQFVA
ncbi:hypothetical protein K438DRAFT_1952684 [Mycena galopus ATCC 62051]|nr:hypothetical protein K438DRAFT_1952684 [Mycena galopus ATCC 62051]